MKPADLRVEQFSGYPPLARALATQHVELLRRLPGSFVPLLLREAIAYDWKFPAERAELDRQFAYLEPLHDEQLKRTMSGFAGLRLSAELESVNWVAEPAAFSEQLTAHLWASNQIDRFRAAAVEYVAQYQGETALEPAVPRLGIVVIGQGAPKSSYRLFRKLRPHGVYYSNVKPAGGLKAILDAAAARASEHPQPYGHWYINGGATGQEGLTNISYAGLTPVRAALQSRIQRSFAAGMGSEALRSALARMRPEDVGLRDGVLSCFELSLLTEGSGTQIFSTTFVQWAAREALRRAQPITLVTRFTPRQREKSMKDLLEEAGKEAEVDAAGSLIDADMAAYYTWLNLKRLSGAESSRFAVWYEDRCEAVAISPELPKGTESPTAIDMSDLLRAVS